ncbi:MAG: Multidrug resistance protein MdtC [Chlamydiae bacterium]|nr:Multidrug resistance protein MdtC [Chlamydiota bacterium]
MSEFFIKRVVLTTLLMVSICFLGLYSYFTLPISDMPNVDYPVITITTSYNGADPTTIANNITTPLENQFTAIDGIQTMTSQSTTSKSTIVLEFNLDKSLDEAAQDTQSAINQAATYLPSDLPYPPTYSKTNPSQEPVIYFALYSDTAIESDVYNYAHDIVGRRLSMVDGVSKVTTMGSAYALRFLANPYLMAARKIAIDDISNAMIQASPKRPVGTLYENANQFNLKSDLQLYQAKDYSPVTLRSKGIQQLKLTQLGEVLDSTSITNYSLHYLKGTQAPKNTVFLSIQKQPGQNTIQVIENIEAKLPELQKVLPDSIKLNTFFSMKDWIIEALDDVKLTLLVAFLLVVLVVFVYLGKFFNTLIPVVTLPLAVLGTLTLMKPLNFSLDIISLLAITLSIGFLIDDAVVVLENIFRHMEMGKDVQKASIEGSKQISKTIVSITLSLAAVFIPMILMPGLLGRIFREFSVTILIAVLFSGFLAIILTPLLCSRFMKELNKERELNFVERFSKKLNEKMLAIYEPLLQKALNHKFFMLMIGVSCMVGSLVIFNFLPKGFFPTDDLGFIVGQVNTMEGTSWNKTTEIQKQIEAIVQDNPAYSEMITYVPSSPGNQSLLFLNLKPIKQRKPIEQVILELSSAFSTLQDANVFVFPIPLIQLNLSATQTQGTYLYTLQSVNQDTLLNSYESFLQNLQATPGFMQTYIPSAVSGPTYQLSLNREKMNALNLNAYQVENNLSLSFSQARISTIAATEDQYNVIPLIDPNLAKNVQDLSTLYLRSSTNQFVPVSSIASWKLIDGLQTIEHFNGLPSLSISFDLSIPLDDAISKLSTLEKNLPQGVFGDLQGVSQDYQKTMLQFGFLILFAVFAIYAILGILYESFVHPLTALSALFPATIGAFLTLFIFQQEFTIYAFVGLMMLIGIVMKNGIMMIEFANENLHQNADLSPFDAILDACKVRFRPIIMTTLAAMMGAVPIAVGIGGSIAQGRKPLGLVIIGGLIFSQLITLFLTPVVFVYLENLRRRFKS